MIKSYRKKPVVVQAIKWTGSNLREVIAFTGHLVPVQYYKWEDYEDLVAQHGLKIFTLEGNRMATTGDMIIKGVHGEVYPCKPDIFAKTYDPVEWDIRGGGGSVMTVKIVEATERANIARRKADAAKKEYERCDAALDVAISELLALKNISQERITEAIEEE